MKLNDDYESSWDEAYEKGQNYLFYPEEELIKFLSKYIKRQTDIYDYIQVANIKYNRAMDIGCGIGRNILLCEKYGFETYGVDLSSAAIKKAIKFLHSAGVNDCEKRLIASDASNLPFEKYGFDFVISHGTLDSMPYDVAKKIVQEISKYLDSGGYFYFDVISSESSANENKGAGEIIVKNDHEKGTVQSFFDMSKIIQLLGEEFELIEVQKKQTNNILKGGMNSRYYVVCKKI